MQIERTFCGWLIEPSTSDEEKHLSFLIDALERAYSGTAFIAEPAIAASVSSTSQ